MINSIKKFFFQKRIFWPKNFSDNDYLLFKAATYSENPDEFALQIKDETLILKFLYLNKTISFETQKKLIKNIKDSNALKSLVLNKISNRTSFFALTGLTSKDVSDDIKSKIKKIVQSDKSFINESDLDEILKFQILNQDELFELGKKFKKSFPELELIINRLKSPNLISDLIELSGLDTVSKYTRPEIIQNKIAYLSRLKTVSEESQIDNIQSEIELTKNILRESEEREDDQQDRLMQAYEDMK